ncbi:HNH endonuclease [Shimia sp. R9_2]|uniref:HNH endonuclease n=1 Tax=Shimia sp. R9_2 TaxID=2821112 RepID=UPI001ADC50F0|nr:HNH endonuclease signature motif containing protein [Shimia sp. R9_2]MBO9398765.1 HNH endonuclease [Shimia sp. R9_2]
MPRRKRTPLQRAAIFQAHDGTCHICGEKIDGTREKWELEHIVAYELTRDDSDENLAPAHVSCHKQKTRKDKAAIAKAKRVNAKHIGAHQPKSNLPGSRASKFKRKLDGTVVPRD